MKPVLFAVLALVLASAAHAEEILSPTKIGIGFHGSETPLGVRWWVGKSVALDGGFGFDQADIGGRKLTRLTGEFGVPLRLASWERVGFYLRPGISYTSQDMLQGFPFPSGTTDHGVTGSLKAEAEVFVVSRVSLSGSFGFQYSHHDNGALPSTDEFETTGGNFTNLGFHIYFGGPR